MIRTRLKILLIEGRNGVAASLLAEHPDFEFTLAERITSAVRIAGERRVLGYSFDVLLLDLTTSAAAITPDDEGVDAFRLARALFPGTPIVTLGLSSEGQFAEAMISEGAQACLEKVGLEVNVLGASLTQAVLRSRAEARRFKALFDSAPIGILLAVGRRVVMANPDALATLGRTQEDLLHLSVLDLFPTDSQSILEKALDADGSGEIPEASFDAQLPRLDGSILRCRVFVKGALLNNAPAVALYLAPMMDIDSRQPSPALSLRQTRKMEALGRLAEGVSHDFNNLLTAINGYSEHLLTLTGDSGPLANGLNAIRRAGDAATELTRRLLTFSRADIEVGVPLVYDDVIMGMLPRLQSMLGQSIDLRLSLNAPQLKLNSEIAQLEQIIFNLSLNAREAMPDGGQLIISTQASPAAGPLDYSHLAAGAGPHLLLTVEDAGMGMDRDVLETMFEPFFTTKRGGRGTGLGLATVYGIMSQMGGGISVRSVRGKGSSIQLYFSTDMAVPMKSIVKTLVSPIVKEERQGENILLVEDDSSLREMLRTVMARSGFKVMEAESIEEAMEKVQTIKEPIDLIVTDVMLRGDVSLDHWERLEILRPGQRTLYISGHSLDTLSDRGILVPSDAFLEKPFTPTQLIAKVRFLLETSRRNS
jgi:two-component system, cell cycle sensor histidine kinase and response regulator CckA